MLSLSCPLFCICATPVLQAQGEKLKRAFVRARGSAFVRLLALLLQALLFVGKVLLLSLTVCKLDAHVGVAQEEAEVGAELTGIMRAATEAGWARAQARVRWGVKQAKEQTNQERAGKDVQPQQFDSTFARTCTVVPGPFFLLMGWDGLPA